MKRAFIFRGPPAAGKGTLVKRFAEGLGGKVAYLDLDIFRWGFHLIGRQVKDVSPAEHRLAFDNLLAVLERYCQNDYTLVLDGLFTWSDRQSSQGSVQAIIDILGQYGYKYKSIVLTAAKDELHARNEQRPYAVPQHEFDELYNGVMSKIGPDEMIIDSTRHTPDQTLKEINHSVL